MVPASSTHRANLASASPITKITNMTEDIKKTYSQNTRYFQKYAEKLRSDPHSTRFQGACKGVTDFFKNPSAYYPEGRRFALECLEILYSLSSNSSDHLNIPSALVAVRPFVESVRRNVDKFKRSGRDNRPRILEMCDAIEHVIKQVPPVDIPSRTPSASSLSPDSAPTPESYNIERSDSLRTLFDSTWADPAPEPGTESQSSSAKTKTPKGLTAGERRALLRPMLSILTRQARDRVSSDDDAREAAIVVAHEYMDDILHLALEAAMKYKQLGSTTLAELLRPEVVGSTREEDTAMSPAADPAEDDEEMEPNGTITPTPASMPSPAVSFSYESTTKPSVSGVVADVETAEEPVSAISLTAGEGQTQDIDTAMVGLSTGVGAVTLAEADLRLWNQESASPQKRRRSTTVSEEERPFGGLDDSRKRMRVIEAHLTPPAITTTTTTYMTLASYTFTGETIKKAAIAFDVDDLLHADLVRSNATRLIISSNYSPADGDLWWTSVLLTTNPMTDEETRSIFHATSLPGMVAFSQLDPEHILRGRNALVLERLGGLRALEGASIDIRVAREEVQTASATEMDLS